MTGRDWLNVIDQAAAAGARKVQFIGGEATLRTELPELINHAVSLGMQVEVFSNLIHVRPALWPVLRQRGVTLATSYYSDQADEHEAITRHRGSYAKTRKNIAQALAYRIPVRASVVHAREGQRVTEAVAELHTLGVTDVRTDRLREIGRGAGTSDAHDMTELCGRCARGRAAVLPDGSVAGCVMSGGMLTAGNVLTTPLAEIVTSPEWAALAASIPQPPRRQRGIRRFVLRLAGRPATPDVHDGCTPDEDSCMPSPGVDSQPGALRRVISAPARIFGGRRPAYTVTACGPDQDGSDCAPAETEACGPSY